MATYLDEASLTFPGRNLDVYMVDMERIEVLEGPQGTLFGGGAEAGALRYITNKPKLDVTEGRAEAATAPPPTAIRIPASIVVNLPVIADTWQCAVCSTTIVAAATSTTCRRAFTRNPTRQGPSAYSSLSGEPGHANNFNLAQRAQNPTTYQASALLRSARSTTIGMC